MRFLVLITVVALLVSPGRIALASHPQSVTIKSFDGKTLFAFPVGDDVGGVSLALADLGTDGIPEIIVGAGLGSEPRVMVLRQDGSQVGSFLAYASTLGVGVNVIACDLTGDGVNEIVTAPQRGGGPHVRVWNAMGEAIDRGGFFAYEESFRAGVNLACGDLTGDGTAELVTLPGPGGGPHVRVWSWDAGDMQMTENFFAFHESDRSGLVGTVYDGELIVAQQHTQTPTVKHLVIHSSPTVTEEKIFPLNALGVMSLVVFNDQVVLSTTDGGLLYDLTQDTLQSLDVAHGSLILATDGTQVIYSQGRKLFASSTDPQSIVVDISQQRLYAWEEGILQNSFLISSGKNNTTPLGNHRILAKLPLVHYAWFYGDGSPYNYDLGWVPYNLRFYPHIYIHYAPWHNNFGHPMSHGCVNVSLEDMKWIYEWAQVGAPVNVLES
ncbi:L,D-transpeptidase [Candidatus Uhrbacteria bacterium]|nr:L,D-transpeptidase [Candidatus Uhrbacteria bacterium]